MASKPMHDCLQIIQQINSSWPDFIDIQLEDPDVEIFTDGRSFMDQEEKKKAEYAVVIHWQVLEAEALPPEH